MDTLLILFCWVLVAAACAIGFGVVAHSMARDLQERNGRE